jgi:acyl-homoserine lactone acylase PvdQ
MPSQWYQIQATYQNNGANHSISGISCTGVPFIVGKTDYLAMGITTIYMDNQDLYREKIEGDKYLVNNKWVNLKIREEKIKIKTSEGLQ